MERDKIKMLLHGWLNLIYGNEETAQGQAILKCINDVILIFNVTSKEIEEWSIAQTLYLLNSL